MKKVFGWFFTEDISKEAAAELKIDFIVKETLQEEAVERAKRIAAIDDLVDSLIKEKKKLKARRVQASKT